MPYNEEFLNCPDKPMVKELFLLPYIFVFMMAWKRQVQRHSSSSVLSVSSFTLSEQWAINFGLSDISNGKWA
ncbi:MAG: hypothetical protein NC252_00670 [Roseburia sp.]|nr:hypothetical protein [Roseburia sp.]